MKTFKRLSCCRKYVHVSRAKQAKIALIPHLYPVLTEVNKTIHRNTHFK